MRSMKVWMFASLCIALPSVAVWGQDDVVEVTVEGEGISKERALKAAKRAAIEKGAGSEISSHSQVESFELVRDAIYARADGLVTEYVVLEEGAAAGGTAGVGGGGVAGGGRGVPGQETWQGGGEGMGGPLPPAGVG